MKTFCIINYTNWKIQRNIPESSKKFEKFKLDEKGIKFRENEFGDLIITK